MISFKSPTSKVALIAAVSLLTIGDLLTPVVHAAGFGDAQAQAAAVLVPSRALSATAKTQTARDTRRSPADADAQARAQQIIRGTTVASKTRYLASTAVGKHTDAESTVARAAVKRLDAQVSAGRLLQGRPTN